MHPFFIYLIQVNIALALFYLLYVIVLKRDTFLGLRRFYFLSAIAFSLLYPFWSIPVLGDFWGSFFMPGNAEALILIGEPSAMVIEEDAGNAASILWSKVISLVYIIFTLAFVLRFTVQLLSILRMNMRSERGVITGVPVYQLKDDIAPFSFFNRIFIHSEKHSEAELSQILLHEQTHARQWHSVDIMLIELVCLFSWWNPLVWLLKREMAMNLEYMADKGVLCEGIDSREYQYHLLRLTYQETAMQLVNNFNMSQLKQRIMMMNKTKSPTLKLVKYLLIFPLAFLLVFANSCVNRDKKGGGDETTEMGTPGSTDIPGIIAEEPDTVIVDDSEVFVVVEDQPQFPGGNVAMMKFLGENIKYPVEAQQKGTEGRVIVNFVVEKDGRLSDFNVVNSIDPLLDAEALRVLESMPKWIPGKQRGEEVRVRFTLPVVFRLQAKDDKKTAMPSASNEVFVVVENQPEFPGGNAAMMKFLSDNIKYPKSAQDNGIQGRVIVNFVVEKDGSLSDVQVVHSQDPALDKEAVRVIESMPKWKPGTQRGETVRVRYTLPVVFRLQN
ncbi:MAG: M56 family metallopeptidase [Proteiniphilum sp.]|jgi:TonB family protein|uniref:M56 family metallopeptidase n=1 Tax=Proteiniphilum sp. TaxID=1926877 RepID=UPI000925AA94|nr:M56 family metallopeptidase [Proteiniphilum sp.]MEA5129914.1 M56 family metallopeptidase [Proteiniphilum sp.]OJV83035.1 MAG: hypothetical protein BGO34_22185 [Bacteroidia bacterium 44-10]